MDPERRKLSSTPDWATGCMIRFVGTQTRMTCRQCDEVLCTVTHNDSLWVLADVARDPACRQGDEPVTKPETKLNRVRRYCEKVIARADSFEERTGKAATMALGWDAQREMAKALLRLVERP